MPLLPPFLALKTALLTGFFLLVTGGAFAQQEAPVKESLSPAPPAVETPRATGQVVPQAPIRPAPAVREAAPFRPGLRFGLQAGTMVGGGLGVASYVAPTAFYDLSPRFRAFGTVSYLRHQHPGLFPTENQFAVNPTAFGTNHLMVQAGGQYDASDRLTLTGSVWRDLSNMAPANPIYRNTFGMGGNGMAFRADLKISEHFSISGGMRYGNGNGNRTMFPSMFHPGMYSPFGF
ncbi:hypothetical protein BH24BAC1_BH24BAC1_00940 [soil metagenome]